jgi:hypothetical protein
VEADEPVPVVVVLALVAEYIKTDTSGSEELTVGAGGPAT